MEVDNLLVHLGFYLVVVGSGLVADDYQLVLGGLSIVVVFPPCLLCDERFLFCCANFCCPMTRSQTVERTLRKLQNVERGAQNLAASVCDRENSIQCLVS